MDKHSPILHTVLALPAAILLSAVLALAGCGGGGSAAVADPAAVIPTPAPTPDPAPPPAPTPPSATNPDLATSVSPATYAVGSTEKGAWDTLQRERQACGFGLVQQDSRLDVAAQAHADYLVKNSIEKGAWVAGHYEDPTWPYFYGVTPSDRAARAGFPWGVEEIWHAQYGLSAATGPALLTAGEALGASSIRTLIETVYHARGAFWAGRSAGVGATLATAPWSDPRWNHTEFRLVAEVSDELDAQKQKLGSGVVASWPCAGLTGVGGSFVPAEESPNPFPEITSAAIVYGTPIYFKADAGSALVITSATVTKAGDSAPITVRQLTSDNDPVKYIGANEVFFVATRPYAPGTSYAVSATGTLNGTPFTKAFTFSTAAPTP